MANIVPLLEKESLDETRDRVNRQFNELNNDIKNTNERVNTIIQGNSPNKDPELTDIKTPDPSYKPARTINVAGDIVRDMQKQFSEQLADTTHKTTELEATKASKADLLTQAARIDNLTANAGDTDGNAELLDIRVTADGEVETTAGEAIRKQYRKAETTARTGIVTESKAEALLKYEHYKDGALLRADTSSIGKSLDTVPTSNSNGALNIIIDVEKTNYITYPLFKTSEAFGCLMLDTNNVVVWAHANTTLDTGSYSTLEIPITAKYFVLSISGSLDLLGWTISYPSEIKVELDNLSRTKETLNKSAVSRLYGKFETDSYITAVNAIGQNLADVTRGRGGGAYLVRIDVSNRVALTYPVFKTSSGFGSVIVDENDVVIWEYCETVKDTGSTKEIVIPTGAKYFILGISVSLSALDWSISFLREIPKDIISGIITDVDELKNNTSTSTDLPENNYLTLGALRTDILTNKIPYHKGYLFHKLDSDRSLWYGKNFDEIKRIGTPNFHPKDCLLAMSPLDGRVIATRRGRYGSLWVWDGSTTHELFREESAVRPKGWLYNSGVEFTRDANGIEYCLFAEYGGDVTAQTGGFNVWRGTYPYTSEDDWEVVFYQDYDGEVTDKSNAISHFHQVRRDPWTGVLYLTSGDANQYCKWWYSLDDGITWQLLSTGPTSGWEDHVLRCINFVFTKDYIYWAVDHGVNHSLNRIERNAQTGIIDMGTRFKLTDLPYAQATNTLCYVESPNGLFMFDRWDYGPQFEPYFENPIQVQFWSFEDEQLHTVTQLRMSNNSWGGHRGKCYTNYTNGAEPRPAMGFSDDTRCNFDLVNPRPSDIGTIFYEIKDGVFKYIV